MGMRELLFQVEVPEWPVAAFTRDTKDSRVIMNHIRFDEDHFPTRNIFTVLADPEEAQKALELMRQMYTNIQVLRQDPQALSVLVIGQAGDPARRLPAGHHLARGHLVESRRRRQLVDLSEPAATRFGGPKQQLLLPRVLERLAAGATGHQGVVLPRLPLAHPVHQREARPGGAEDVGDRASCRRIRPASNASWIQSMISYSRLDW